MITALLCLLLWPASQPEAGPGPRGSITFILGADEDAAPPALRLAEAHFRRDPMERTDDVVLGLRSLEEVRRHLATAPRPGDRPWGVVNLVVHGNATGYLDVDLRRGGPKVDADSLAGDRDPLPDAVLDGASEIRLHGCAAGRNGRLLSRLARWFGGDDAARPVVRASLHYTSFQAPAGTGGGAGGAPSRSLCECWDAYHRNGEPPPAQALARAARAGVPLEEALANRVLPRSGGAYSYEAPVRFTWTVVYPGAMSPRSAPAGKAALQWLLGQEAFLQRLRAAGLAPQHLDWTLRATTREVDGVPCPALCATGEGRVLHVLRQLTRPPGKDGPEPHTAWDDPRYYAASR